MPAMVGLVLALAATPVEAVAAWSLGGAINARGERSHNIGIGWPAVSYHWEGLVRDKVALGPRVEVQIWPIAISAGLQARFLMFDRGRASISLLAVPGIHFAGYGGSRATYDAAWNFGRSRSFRPSLGPGVNAGVLATVDVRPKIDLHFTFENPLTFWIWANNGAWWIEWPITFSAAAEFEVSWQTSLVLRLGGGPSIAFAGPSALLGFHAHATFGIQVRH